MKKEKEKIKNAQIAFLDFYCCREFVSCLQRNGNEMDLVPGYPDEKAHPLTALLMDSLPAI